MPSCFGCCCAEVDSAPDVVKKAALISPLGGRAPGGGGARKEDAMADREAPEAEKEPLALQAAATTVPEEERGFTALVLMPKGRGPGAAIDACESAGRHLRIARIEAMGPLASYNERAPESQRIREGDFIVAPAGGIESARGLFSNIMAGGVVELLVRHPETVALGPLDKSQGRLGLRFSTHPQSSSIYIKQVFPEGLIASHNEAHPELEVRPGDCIVSVNGERGSSNQLLKIINASETVELVVTRPQELL